MKSLLGKTAFSLMALAFVFSTSTASAQSLRKATPRKSAHPAQRTADVTLSSRGVFSGYVLDAQGRPMANEAVLVRQGMRRVAQVRTNKAGQFQVVGMRGGVYQVVVRKSSSMFRVWTPSAAPKGARQLALVVRNQQVVRGQGVVPPAFAADFGTLASTGIAAGGATVGVMAAEDAQNAEEMNQQLQAQLTALEAMVNSP